jgi:hypothetical protein
MHMRLLAIKEDHLQRRLIVFLQEGIDSSGEFGKEGTGPGRIGGPDELAVELLPVDPRLRVVMRSKNQSPRCIRVLREDEVGKVGRPG